MLQQRYDRTIEEKWQKEWAEKGIYRFDENDTARPIFSIDTPPPFTSGELHMGHVLSYSYFDFAARYKRMNGFNVYYPQGWDTQGFPTEVKVEKKFGRLPPVQFREKCVEWTVEMIDRMKTQMNQMGFSPDWRYEYRTMDPEYHRKVQLSLIKMYGDKLVYRDKYPVYWCPRCVSAVAKAELDDEEKDGTIIHIRFTGPEGEDLIIATTRPEMLHACQAVLFNPADERYKHLEGKHVKTPLGKEIVAVSDKDVDKEFGSGLVMVCTFGDKMDVVWMHRHKLLLHEAIDQHGKMKNSGSLDGLKIPEAKKKITEELEAAGKIVKRDQLKQVVKVHDRCKTPVELIPSLQWFADIRTTAKHIKAMAGRIKWVPDFGISYLIDWVENAEWDWVISRQRVFGTPLPFYYCEKCGKTGAAGEGELPFYPEKAKGKACECGETMKPETSTCDCWVDSSITPLIISGWPDEKKMQRLYPVSLRPQGVEIVRTWAFYTIYRSGVALTNIPPFETILLNGNVLAPDGKKMSKSLGNIISPAELLKDYPTDAIRQWAALSGAMAKDRPFSFEDIKYAKSFLSKVWNAARFAETLGKPKGEPELSLTDKWITGRLNSVIRQCTEDMEKFEYHHAMKILQDFFWHDFCDDYLEYIKHRVYGDKGKDAAIFTLNRVLGESLRLLAPLTPHISEEIYHELYGKSVHTETWPAAGDEYPVEVGKVAVLGQIVTEIRQHKSKNKLPQNAELASVRLSLPEEMDAALVEELKEISKIKNVEIVRGEFGVSV
ncbi:MAG TPA: valine--tRNA ligase [Candidatus Bilamarchaeum sp.]|nr:valine--tRNA ligase [Candidatus Bilamarchaeum sp.]